MLSLSTESHGKNERGSSSEVPDDLRDEPKKGFSISFTKRIMLVAMLVSLITILVSAAVLSFVWEQHFQSYTRENVQRLAESTAQSVGVAYDRSHGDWYGGALASASAASELNSSVHIQVRSSDGTVVYDDSPDDALGSVGMKDSGASVASAPIITPDDDTVGTVFVRVAGSDTLLTQADADFREKSYQAITLAGVIALLVAVSVGAVFARGLTAPIKRITTAAAAIKEGDYTARTGLRGDDEISRLGFTFDRMAESVEQNRKLERRLVTDVAHELRTPLMAIQSTVEAMIDGVFEPDAERLETLNSEVRRLSRLVDALLKLSRLEGRTKPIERKKVDLTELLSTVVGTHQAYIQEAGLNLKFEYDPHVFVFGDADLLRQATANLISNAVRYTPEGGTITVIARKGDIMGQIIVRDTGIGLTAEEAKMVFQRFWRADPGRARSTGGLGVGLSVVKEIVDQHNGWVRVEGRPNEGACFTIHIPLFNEDDQKKRSGRRRD